MKHGIHSIILFLVFAFYAEQGISQPLLAVEQKKAFASLPRSLPEEEGVSSERILNFLNAAEKSKTELHSFMMLRHGKVIVEGWWKPYEPDLKHTMYSCSKSFVATAIGFAINENRLTVNDKVISFFPDDQPATISENLSELSVKDLLSMSVGQEPDPTRSIVSRDSNWVKSFLALPIMHKPGSRFLYNSMATYMLSAIVQKLTGQKVIDYLKPRLFDPLGIEGMDWEVDSQDINTGGWGLRIKTEDLAKFGQLFLQNGKWEGEQLLPASWIKEASTVKILQHPDYSQEKRDSSDWEQGYCYQMWRCRHNAYRGDGAFGQFIIVMPDQEVVIAMTAETANMQEEINLVWEYLLPGMHNSRLPVNNITATRLQQKISSLALPLSNNSIPSKAEKLFNKTYAFSPNEKEFQSFSFNFNNNTCSLNMVADSISYPLTFGAGKWQLSETTKRGPYLVAGAKAGYVGLPPLKVAGSYSWSDKQTLELTLRYIESPHTEKMVCRFTDKNISVDIENSMDGGKSKLTLQGTVKE